MLLYVERYQKKVGVYMFSFFKRKKREKVTEVESHILNDDLCRRAMCSNALFQNPILFLDMKLTNENRDSFIENNFFNLRYTGGTESYWNKEKKNLIPAMKEGLQLGYDIVDKESYEVVFNSFAEGGLTHAWDIVRMVGVTQNAYTASYIDLLLAKEKISFLGKKLSENYSSWEDLIKDFVLGKLEFNDIKELEGEDIKIFSDVNDILVMVDFLFNDKDTPLKKVLFNKDEDLTKGARNIFENIASVHQRARNMMKVYKKVYGWEPFVVIDNNFDDERAENTYRFVEDKLELKPSEKIVFMHVLTEKKPEKAEVQLILTNKNIVVFPTEDKRFIYIPLNEINDKSIEVKGYAMELFVNGSKIMELFSLNSKNDIPPYLEIVYDMVVFLRNNS